jgi:hypothetical protein
MAQQDLRVEAVAERRLGQLDAMRAEPSPDLVALGEERRREPGRLPLSTPTARSITPNSSSIATSMSRTSASIATTLGRPRRRIP